MLGRLRKSEEWQLFRAMSKADPVLSALWWGLLVARGALPAIFAVCMGAVVGTIQAGRQPGTFLVLVGITFVAMNAAGPIHSAIGLNLGGRTAAWLHDRLLESCALPPGLAHLERPDMADSLATARDFEVGISAPPMSGCIPEIGAGFVQIAGGLAQALVLATYRWWAPIAVGGAWFSTHMLLRKSAEWRDRGSPEVVEEQRHADYSYRLAVEAPASKEVRLFGLANWVVDRFETRKRNLFDLSWRARKVQRNPLAMCLLLIVAGNALVFWSLARDAGAGHISIAAIVVYATAAVGTATLAFSEFDWWLSVAAQPVPVVLDLAEKMRPAGALKSGARAADGLPAREIRFQGVRFAYPTTNVPVLDGFDLTIPAGRSLAIVGQNGAGKTTLAKLLCRLYDPVDGAVLVDGVDLREFDVDSWRSRIAAVFQDYIRYELPLRDNVAPHGASDDEVTKALRAARAESLAGLDTVLSRQYEGGTDLSGGQWQRIALARAVCAVQLGAGVVLLDEPTAQLDVRGEAEIFDRLLDATRGCTTILISHRFSTVRHADSICVLEHGRVIELGSHDELMQQAGRYRTMFDLQASRFEEEDEENLETLDA